MIPLKKYILNIVFVLAGLFLIGVLFFEKSLNFFTAENDFRIKDTTAVNCIEILSEDSIILTRMDTSWIMNDGAPASNIAVDNFLLFFQRICIKGISSGSAITEEKGTRLKIMEGRKKHYLRFYIIDDVLYLHKEGAGKLYAVEVPGFPDINPTQIISPDIDHWRDRTLIGLKAGEIKKIAVLHPDNPENDFVIKNKNGNPYLFGGQGKNQVPENLIDREKLDFYLSYFNNVFYDFSVDDVVQIDKEARWTLVLEDTSSRKYSLKVYPMKTPSGEDMFKAYIKFNNQSGYKVTRFMVLDLLLQDKQHFMLD